MSRRDNAAHRCHGCRLHRTLCMCALIPRIATRTRLLLIMHRFEDRKATNTGRLATQCLSNSAVLVRGHAGSPSEPLYFGADTRPLLLFPHDGALPLPSFDDGPPVTLIVPDGNWRQASRVRKRVPGLEHIPCVALPATKPSRYQLRAEVREHGLATCEAIARAFGILEGPQVEIAIERAFAAMVERTLWARGQLARHQLTSALAEHVQRHDPRARQ